MAFWSNVCFTEKSVHCVHRLIFAHVGSCTMKICNKPAPCQIVRIGGVLYEA